jgi:hypothetical protein
MCRNIKRISDIITTEDIKTWSVDVPIFIEAPTGRGKSYFIKHTLSEYAKNKKILILVNRTIIKNQSENELGKSENSNIKITTYQNLSNKILEGNTLEYEGYDYIISDEAHHYCEESLFCFESDVVFEWMISRTAIKVFMTATAFYIKKYLTEELKLKIKHYYIKNDYNYIEKLYFYEDDKVIHKLLLDIPPNEKAIYFTNANKAYETSEILESCAFYCSDNNSTYRQYSNQETIKQIEENEMFEEQVLITTKVMDCGVNICDTSVKHIIVDMVDISSLIQCIGRKRIQGDEKIILYIKDKKGNSIARKLEHISEKLRYAIFMRENGETELVKENKHKNTYGNMIYDIINPSTQQISKKINELMFFTYSEDKKTYAEMSENKEHGFKNKLFERMGVTMEFTYAEDEMDSAKLEDILDRLVGKKMFEEEQEEFIKFMRNQLFKGITNKYGTVKIKTINGYFEDNEIPYIIESKKERSRKDINYNKHYWILCKKIYEIEN